MDLEQRQRAFGASAGNHLAVHDRNTGRFFYRCPEHRIQGVSFIAVLSTASDIGLLYDKTATLCEMVERPQRYVDTTSALTL
jgi:hypothetical protein